MRKWKTNIAHRTNYHIWHEVKYQYQVTDQTGHATPYCHPAVLWSSSIFNRSQSTSRHLPSDTVSTIYYKELQEPKHTKKKVITDCWFNSFKKYHMERWLSAKHIKLLSFYVHKKHSFVVSTDMNSLLFFRIWGWDQLPSLLILTGSFSCWKRGKFCFCCITTTKSTAIRSDELVPPMDNK